MRQCPRAAVWFIFQLSISVQAETAPAKKSWTLYHGWTQGGGSVDFQPRGRVQLEHHPENEKLQLTIENENSHANLVASKWYQLKLVPDDDNDAAASVMTTVPSCLVRRANFRDEFSVTFDNSGNILSLSYMPLVSPFAPKTCDELPELEEAPKFQSKISFETGVEGMTLHTVLPPQKPPPGMVFFSPKGRNTKGAPPAGDGDTKEQPDPFDASPFGFMKKYWYIILPLVLMNFFQAEDPQQQQQQEGQQGQQQVQGGGAAQQQQRQLPPQGGGAAPKQRRGKRG